MTAGQLNFLTQHPRIISGTIARNWNTGVATSGFAGGDLFTLGAPNIWWILSGSFMLLSAFNAAASVTMRGYQTLMGAERQAWADTWTVALDGEVAFISYWFEVPIRGQIRVEVNSDQVADDGLIATYESWVKDW